MDDGVVEGVKRKAQCGSVRRERIMVSARVREWEGCAGWRVYFCGILGGLLCRWEWCVCCDVVVVVVMVVQSCLYRKDVG